MKKILYLLVAVISAFSLSSCLTRNLEELPTYDGAEILSFYFECRFIDSESNKLRVTTMNSEVVIDSSAATVTCDIVVPDANTTTLSEDEREEVSLSTLVGYCDISTAATIAPVGNSPTLGGQADWSDMENEYLVTAADGTEKTWTVIINSFTK